MSMSIIRGLGRTMFASYFIVKGTNSAMKPDSFVEDAAPVVDRLLPVVQHALPASISAHIPEDTKTLVRATGAAQAFGGLGMATGLARRAGAGVVAATMVPHVLASIPDKTSPKDERTAARSVLLRNVALLGGAMMASRDTAGHPSLAWRAADTQRRVSSAASGQRKAITSSVDGLSKSARKKLEKAQKKAKKAQKKIAD
ncbi:DoxX family membrane protein [Cutibacterium acnes]|nr:DoxX protein [Cutibacterium acnes HL201PA1]KPG65112.1 DoxX family protein [Cutibacterium acnes]KPG65179.1 DoxX family protein [Cutibacterium acnes]WGH35811.1 DoxX family membrane protein [Cutibacterium acnes]WGH39478.1 DoxX family membrane protein [Cutibacterium acnes]